LKKKGLVVTVWDKIYRDKKKIGDISAVPSDRFLPMFRRFLKDSSSGIKHALDIGCGIGKYLKILQSEGFQTDGIDSSETAIEMTNKLLDDHSDIRCVDMFENKIPENKYDLVLSILTLQHGTKQQIEKLVENIYDSIVPQGKIFITLPDIKSSEDWNSFKNRQEIAEGTFVPLSGPEKGLPHSFFSEQEIRKVFSRFQNLKLDADSQGNWIIQASKGV
jgi:2-polyprenyl-3-methyl-5-hydroxy-6-metoxy-1,4-benzoquinol methylase